jgi:glycosyltransferase involved in cell wall biosynthesis
MLIGFDAKRAAQNGTGLGNYSRFIIRLLALSGRDVSVRLYVPNRRKTRLLSRLPASSAITTVFPEGIWRRLPSLWRIGGITPQLERDGIDIYHGLSNELPLNIGRARGIRTIVTIHDLLFLRYPQGYHAIDRWIYNYKFRHACQVADRIIAVSEFTKQEIVSRYGIPAEKISVVYQGCDPAFRTAADEATRAEVRAAYHLPAHYILYVGSIESRKNLMLLAKALGKIQTGTEVIAVGRRTPYADAVEACIRQQGLESRMRLISGVPFEHLPALYQMADVFVYPSRCEGFGIPLLEALCSGVPAIGCTGSCLEEAGGPDSAYVDPDDEDALAAEINDILTNEKRRRHMTEAGRDYADRFTDQRLLNDLMQVYREVGGKD